MIQIATTAANDVKMWVAGAGICIISLAIIAISGFALAYMEYYYERKGRRR